MFKAWVTDTPTWRDWGDKRESEEAVWQGVVSALAVRQVCEFRSQGKTEFQAKSDQQGQLLLSGQVRWRLTTDCRIQGYGGHWWPWLGQLRGTVESKVYWSGLCRRNGNPLRYSFLEEPSGLLSTGSHRVGNNWSDLASMHALEKEMATHSSNLAWRIPGMEELGGLPSMGSHRVRHDWSDLAAAAQESVERNEEDKRDCSCGKFWCKR